MTKYLTIGAGLLLLAGSSVAFAQMPPGGGPGGPGGPGPRGPMMERHGEWGMRHMGFGHGTAFRFRKGDAEADIVCSPRDPLQDCVAAASALLDKLNSAPAKPTSTP